MKKLSLLIFLVCGISFFASAQGDTLRMHPFKQYVPQDELDKFNLRQMKINRRGSYVLSGWGLGNVIYGSIALSQSHGEARYFHMSNAIWGSINLIVGMPGVIATYNKSRYNGLSFGKTVLQQHGAEKIYLINGVLDFAYITAGVGMWGFSDRISSVKTRQGVSGAGTSTLAQGGFLLVFDWTMYILHSQHAYNDLNRYTSGLAFTGTGFSYSLMF